MRDKLQKALFFLLIAGSLSLWAPQPAAAQSYLYSRQGAIDLNLGLGMLVRGPRFDMQISGEWYWRNNISWGLSFDTYIGSGGTAFSFRPFGRYHFDISSMPKLVPYIGAGVGGGITTGGAGFMDVVVPNFGFKYALSPRVHLGSDMGLHIITNFTSSRVDFHIQFITISYRF